MLTECPADELGYGLDPQHECEGCGRSMVARFGATVPYECDACRDEFKRLLKAGKIVFEAV